MKKKNAKNNSTKKRGRPVRSVCRALIPLDTAKIRKEYLKEYKRRKKVLEKLEAQLQQYEESDEPEFQKFLARTFGAEQTRQRELAEQMRLCQTRYEKIRFLARENRMAQGRYCFMLLSKVTETMDIWAVLEAELQALQESGKKTRDEEKREMDEAFRKLRHTIWGDDEDDDENMEDEFEEDGSDDFDEAFKQLFGNLFGDEDDSPASESESGELKRLYRELCLRYHPDKIGAHDAKTQRLWNDIQGAYQDGNLDRLRAIRAGIELESGRTELGCSEIDDMILDVEWSIQEKRSELHARKRTPLWGFAKWTALKKKQVEKEIKFEFDRDAEMAQRQLRQMEAELNRLFQWKPKTKTSVSAKIPKKTKAELRKEALADMPDLFDF